MSKSNGTTTPTQGGGSRPQYFPKKGRRKGPVKRVHKPEHEEQQKEKMKKAPGGEAPQKEDEEEAMDGDDGEEVEICLVCAEDIKYAATYPCNHFVCHVCSLRLRALIKNNNCPMCRTEHSTVIVSDNTDKRYEEYSYDDLQYKDEKLGIYFDSLKTRDEVQSLLKFNCPAKKCSHVCSGWKDLKTHVHTVHDRVLCDICMRHKKAFTVEFELFTRRSLLNHQRNGDRNGFAGHPECEFCNIRFYSGDELFMHCREKHEKCFLCERRNPQNIQYYRDYDALENHFREKHFACNVRACLDEKFVVFGTEVELQEHMLTKHPEIMGKSKAARRIEPTFNSSRDRGFQSQLSTFDVSALPSSSNGSGNNTNTNSRKTGAQTTSSANSSSTMVSSGTGLASNEEAFPALGASRTPTSSNNSSSAQLASVARFHSQPPPVDNSREVIQRRLEERARMYLSYDVSRFERFKEVNHKFKNDNVNAKVVMFEYSQIFDVDPSEIELLVQDHVKLLKNLPAKAKALTQAFNEWKAKQKKASVATGTSSLGVSSTWTSNRAKNSKSLNSSGDAFPSLPSRSEPSASATLAAPGPSSSSSSSAANNKQPSVSSVASGVRRITVKSSPLRKEDFPSLPASNQPTKPPPVRPAVVHNPSDWGRRSEQAQDEEQPRQEYQKKGNKGKKKVLYHIGF
ncbi:hypothetical protein TRICI_003743 [Trichomonascus ciferrii]|uniref:RING-type E3 ubiquitin transferase n=1 Tax=Trichomonascus ciferrii TaxID=44093 RepID=A0A642V2X3_9ASCO|nr:hypothetical protein TRICI_003743 [Trichomonascus ciferrii]